MASKSSHYNDILSWIKDMIESSERYDHLKVCEKLLNNFENLYFSNKYPSRRHESFREVQNLKNIIVKKEFQKFKK